MGVLSEAHARADEIEKHKFVNMGVTYSPDGEYTSALDILSPIQGEPMAGWRVAKSLEKLREQVNAKWPNRSKSDDGTIGDQAHASRSSDHNPDESGVVHAMDLTHDPAHGFDSYKFADALVASKDPRIKYVISNRRIASATVSPWEWRRYDGENPHDRHVHISVVDGTRADDTSPWKAVAASASPPPTPPKPADTFTGRGSWYSQYEGRYHWVDTGDAPGSAALGVPDDAQGIALPSHDTLGKWFKVTAPNGVTSLEQQTDLGPSGYTGRKIDISAAAAERFGYSPSNFPTNGLFIWQPTDAPDDVAGMNPKDQATHYRDKRKGESKPLHDERWLQVQLQKAGVYAGDIDGDIGPLSIRAMIAYIEKHPA